MKKSTLSSIVQMLMLLVALGVCVAVLGLFREIMGDRSGKGAPGPRHRGDRPARRVVGPRGKENWVRPAPPSDIVLPSPAGREKEPEKPPEREKDAIPNEYVLSFASEADRDAFVRLAESKGCRVLELMAFGNALRLRAGSRKVFDELLAEGPEPSEWSSNYFVRYPSLTPGEPMKPETGYTPFGEMALRWLGVTGNNGAWGKGVTVAVLDTGVAAHSSLDDRAVFQVDLVEDGGRGVGDSGHGTAVASLIAGADENITGVAPSTKVLSIRVLGDDGVGDTFTLARGIVDAVDRGARVINMCLGTYGDSHILREAVDHAVEAGAVLVGAAGNDAVEGVVYPAKYDGVLAVAAVDGVQRHLYFSNRGEEVDLAAPGVGVNAAGPEDGAILFSGTSAAVPFVSGAVAWLLSENPDMTAEDAVDLLLKYTDDAGAPGADEKLGEGILNIDRIANRDIEGIYNAAVGAPYLKTTVDPPMLVFFLQNRGTAELPAVDLKIEMDGIPSVVSFYNVGVGETVSTEYALDASRLAAGKVIQVVCSAVLEGIEDAYPTDNSRKTRIFSPADNSKK